MLCHEIENSKLKNIYLDNLYRDVYVKDHFKNDVKTVLFQYELVLRKIFSFVSLFTETLMVNMVFVL